MTRVPGSSFPAVPGPSYNSAGARDLHAERRTPSAGQQQGAPSVPGSGQARTMAGLLRTRPDSELAASGSDRARKRARVDAPVAPSGPRLNRARRLAVSDTPSSLLQYASPIAKSQVADLVTAAGVDSAKVEQWLTGMCTRANSRRDHDELAACKTLILASCMNAMLKTPGGRETVQNMLARNSEREQHSIVQDLLKQFPIQADWEISDPDWKKINDKSKSYSLLALVAPILDLKSRGYSAAGIIQCAKAARTCQELVALCNPETNARLELGDRLSIVPHHGGVKNLEAASNYLNSLGLKRAKLAEAGVSPEDIDKVLAPVTLTKAELVGVVSQNGGAKSLAAASEYLETQFELRLALCEKGEVDAAINLVPASLTKPEVIKIVSVSGGGAQNLRAAFNYDKALSIPLALLEFAGGTPDELERALAPVTLTRDELRKVLAHNGGAKSLEAATDYLKPLFDQRVALCMDGQFKEAVELAPGALTKDQLTSILKKDGGVGALAKVRGYLSELSAKRATLATKGYSQQQIDEVFAPVVLKAGDLVKMLGRPGGLARVKAAIDCLKPLFEERVALCMANKFTEAIAQGPGDWTLVQLVGILSHQGGEKSLAAANTYRHELGAARARLEAAALSPDQIERVLAPVTLTVKELVSICSQEGSEKRLALGIDHLKLLLEERLALCEQGRLEDAIRQPLGNVTKEELVSVLSTQRGAATFTKIVAAPGPRAMRQALPAEGSSGMAGTALGAADLRAQASRPDEHLSHAPGVQTVADESWEGRPEPIPFDAPDDDKGLAATVDALRDVLMTDSVPEPIPFDAPDDDKGLAATVEALRDVLI